MLRIDIGRTRLPTCVTKIRSVLRFIDILPVDGSGYPFAGLPLRRANLKGERLDVRARLRQTAIAIILKQGETARPEPFSLLNCTCGPELGNREPGSTGARIWV